MDQSANLQEYFPLAYQELKRLAMAKLRAERVGHTLNPTGLVHEAYLNLIRQQNQQFESQRHFFYVASLAMRRVLVDYARKKQSEKRGGDWIRLTLENQEIGPRTSYEDLLQVHESLSTYSERSERGAKIIELWFFGGFTQEEIAAILEISESTVRREWRLARAWLSWQLSDE